MKSADFVGIEFASEVTLQMDSADGRIAKCSLIVLSSRLGSNWRQCIPKSWNPSGGESVRHLHSIRGC